MRLVASPLLRGFVGEFLKEISATTTSLHHHWSCGVLARDRGRRFRL